MQSMRKKILISIIFSFVIIFMGIVKNESYAAWNSEPALGRKGFVKKVICKSCSLISVDLYQNDDKTHMFVHNEKPVFCLKKNFKYKGKYVYTEPHKGGTHANGGKCTVCGKKYQTHTMKRKWKNTATSHYAYYECSTSGCNISTKGGAGKHKGGTHKNGGKCTVCGYKYQTHSNSKKLKGNTPKAKEGHIPVYKCSYSGCSGTYKGTIVKHTGGTHSNGGKCTACGYKYQTHSNSKIISGYKTTSGKHTPIYKCSYSGCRGTYKGTAVSHTGGTHANGGKCTVCKHKYQTHSKSKAVKKYKTTAKKHTPVYKCSHSGCKTTYKGTAVSHKGGTHKNGGKCTVCGYKYQTHSKSSKIKSYKMTREKHTPIYKCLYSGCSTTYTGTAEKHTGGTKENGGKCKECGYVYQTYKEDDSTVIEKKDDDNVNGEADIDISKDKNGSIMAHVREYTNSTENDSSLEITISGNGVMQESVFQKLVNDNIIDANTVIDMLVIEEGVTNISNYAFKDAYIQGPINIPSTIETIGKEAFMNVSKKKDDKIICNLRKYYNRR